MFAEELPHLQPLPVEPFRYYQHGQRGVHLDGHDYSVPPGRIGTQVEVQWDDRHVRTLDRHTGKLPREHRLWGGTGCQARLDRPALDSGLDGDGLGPAERREQENA